jgi:tetratricopeptide (TPR) repeat protein
MDPHNDLERYETTEARDLVRLFAALRPPPVEHAPANFRAKVLAQVAHRQARRGWFAWLAPGRTPPWVPALVTGLLLSVGLNTWLGYQVLEWRKQGAAPALSERSDSAPRQGEEVPREEEHGGSGFTLRGGAPSGTPQRQEEARLPAEADLMRALAELAAMHYHAGRYERCLQVASAALTLNPNAARAYFYRGMAYNGLGNRTQAIEDVRRAARLGEAQAQDVLRTWEAE